MKKLIITFGISGILLTGCVDLLQEPLSFPTPENIEYTEENVTSLANGLYTSLWGGNYAYNCRTILMVFIGINCMSIWRVWRMTS